MVSEIQDRDKKHRRETGNEDPFLYFGLRRSTRLLNHQNGRRRKRKERRKEAVTLRFILEIRVRWINGYRTVYIFAAEILSGELL